MNYQTNKKGGWIIPSGSTIEAVTDIPAYSELGDGCELGYSCELGYGCHLGDDCHLGNSCKLGHRCTLGNSCTLGDYCRLGYSCELGDHCELGHHCTLGHSCELGNDCTWLGVTVARHMQVQNVDGSGRTINLVWGTCGTVKVEAGCFLGTVDEFCAKAEKEGKMRYVRLVRFLAHEEEQNSEAQ